MNILLRHIFIKKFSEKSKSIRTFSKDGFGSGQKSSGSATLVGSIIDNTDQWWAVSLILLTGL
jgi:hypothetical protein